MLASRRSRYAMLSTDTCAWLYQVKGVVLISGKDGDFVSGLDLKMLNEDFGFRVSGFGFRAWCGLSVFLHVVENVRAQLKTLKRALSVSQKEFQTTEGILKRTKYFSPNPSKFPLLCPPFSIFLRNVTSNSASPHSFFDNQERHVCVYFHPGKKKSTPQNLRFVLTSWSRAERFRTSSRSWRAVSPRWLPST
eukprot:1662317-Rhodomonas_salina.4